MLVILIIFLVCALTLMVLLWAGTLFFQGYIYTEPTRGIHWQAPAAAGALAAFYALWCWLVAAAAGAGPGNIPYDTLFRFSPQVEMYAAPVKELWAERNKQTIKFVLDKQGFAPRYKPAWPDGPVDAIMIKDKDGNEDRFLPVDKKTYREFRDAQGWTMKVTPGSGPTGNPVAFRWGLFLGNLLLNFFHLALWFACLWLLLRFQWSHALGLALVMWAIVTVAILPMMLEQAALVAERSRLQG